MIRFSVLASGSTGNAVYVGTDKVHLLIDAGISYRAVSQALKEIGVSAEQLDAVFVTHEHHDHTRGLKTLVQRLQIPVYATAGTWQEIAGQVAGAEKQFRYDIRAGVVIAIGDLHIDPFAIPHDCREPVGFSLYQGSSKLCLVTDLGYVGDRLKETLRGADAYIFEANHDVEMLRTGPYPWHLKQRVLGDKGHLSNEAAGEALAEIVSDRTTDIFLAHLSQENNVPELAVMTVASRLQEFDIPAGDRLRLHVTHPDRPTPIHTIGNK